MFFILLLTQLTAVPIRCKDRRLGDSITPHTSVVVPLTLSMEMMQFDELNLVLHSTNK